MPAFFISAYSQTVHVVYDVKVDVGGMQSKPFNHRYELTNSQGKSVQKKFLAEAGRGKGVNKNSESTRVVKIGNDTTYVYKDFAANRLVSEEKIFTKPFVVAMNWIFFPGKYKQTRLLSLITSAGKRPLRSAAANMLLILQKIFLFPTVRQNSTAFPDWF